MSALLVLDSYGKSFGERVVLHSASIWGTPGRITVVMGRNGSGKSTLLRAGLGLIPSDQGVTHWDGEPILRPRLHALARRGLFFLPDRGMLSKRLPLKDQIGFYLEAFGGNAAQVIEDFRLLDLLDLRVGQLSGGEARRGELALARLRAPRCLVADEPFAGLGPIDRIVVADELRAHARRGAAVIATGHEVEDLMDVADEVVWMVAGTTHVLGGAEVARAHGQFRREYLGLRGGHGGAAGAASA